MVGILVTPFIDCIPFYVTQGQGGPLHWYSEELMSRVQHAYDLKFILEFTAFGSVSIEIIDMAIYFSSEVTAFVIPLKIIPISVIISSRWPTQWSPWQS